MDDQKLLHRVAGEGWVRDGEAMDPLDFQRVQQRALNETVSY